MKLLLFFLSSLFAFTPVDSLETVVVDSVVINTHNAFDDSKANTGIEKWLFDLGNNLRFKTKPSVVSKLLLFSKGDSINFTDIQESERNIRNQTFISESSIKLVRTESGKVLALVDTYDKWTTIPVAGLQKPDKWIYSFGFIEYDLLGLGYQVGAVFYKQLEKEVAIYSFKDPNFLFNNNRLEASYSQNFKNFDRSSGFEMVFKLYRPFVSLRTKWAYTIEALHSEQPEFYYYQRHSTLKRTPLAQAGGQEFNLSKSMVVAQDKAVLQDSLSVRLSRSFVVGEKQRFYTRLSYDYWDRNNQDSSRAYTRFANGENSFIVADTGFYKRKDSRVGFQLSYRDINYIKVKNFNKVKYSEDLEKGYTLRLGASKNSKSLGASSEDWRFDYFSQVRNILASKHFVLSRFQGYTYYNDDFLDGYNSFLAQYQYRPSRSWAMVLKGFGETLWNASPGQQLTTGGLQGFTGAPSFYYAGNSLSYFEAEARYFPDFESLTVAPVLAAFLSAGNAWSRYDKASLDELDYYAGLGLRLGATKSTQGIVNHINLSWPLNGPLENGFVSGAMFSIVTKISL